MGEERDEGGMTDREVMGHLFPAHRFKDDPKPDILVYHPTDQEEARKILDHAYANSFSSGMLHNVKVMSLKPAITRKERRKFTAIIHKALGDGQQVLLIAPETVQVRNYALG